MGINGLDFGPTLVWYAEMYEYLLDRLACLRSDRMRFHYRDNSVEVGYVLSDFEMRRVVQMFPQEFVDRSNLCTVDVEPMAWFSVESVPGRPVMTHKADLALSPTAIIPSRITHQGGETPERWPNFDSRIVLFRILPELPDVPHESEPAVVRVAHIQAAAHEFVHSVVTPALYARDRQLRLQDGRVVSSQDYLLGVQDVVSSCPPISHYASAYMSDDGKLIEDPHDSRVGTTALNEVVTEVITALVLGFAFQGPDRDGLNPFADCGPLGEYLRPFMTAKFV